MIQQRLWWSVFALLAALAGEARADRMAFPAAADQYEPSATPEFERYDRISAGIDVPASAAVAPARPPREFYEKTPDPAQMVAGPESAPHDTEFGSSRFLPVAESLRDAEAVGNEPAVANPHGSAQPPATAEHATASHPPKRRESAVTESTPQSAAVVPPVAEVGRAEWGRHWRQGIFWAAICCVALGFLRYLCAARPEDQRHETYRTRRRRPVLEPGIRIDGANDVPGLPEYMQFFDLDKHAEEADVVRAYREQSRRLHPDRGGDAAEFKAMQRRFEQALAYVRKRGRGRQVQPR